MLGTEQDSAWYNEQHVAALPGYGSTASSTGNVPGFSASTIGGIVSWNRVQQVMDSLSGETSVRFRFYFADDSVSSAAQDGFLIDDVLVEDNFNLSISPLDTISVCHNMPVKLSAPVSKLPGNIEVLWSTGDTSAQTVVGSAGQVWCKVTLGTATQTDFLHIKYEQPKTLGGVISAYQGARRKDSVFDCNNHTTSLYFIPNGSSDLFAWTLPGAIPEFSHSVQSRGKGLYKLQLADWNGCLAEDSIHMVPVSAPLVLLPDEAKGCDTVQVALGLGANPTAIYFPIWKPQHTSIDDTLPVQNSYQFDRPGEFVFIARDGLNFCLVADTVEVYVGPMNNVVETSLDYGFNDGMATLEQPRIWGGNPPLAYDWDSSGVYGSIDTLRGLGQGDYTLYIRDVDGCKDTVPYRVNWEMGVFPGDTDRDGEVSMKDLLSVGLHYMATGPSRNNASIQWTPQPMVSWGRFLSRGTDLCHSDINGDGTINRADTLAILQNYSYRHNNQKSNSTGPEVHFDMPKNYNPGDTLIIPVLIGDSARTIKNLHGIAFSIEYDTSVIKQNSVRIDFSNSILGQNGNDLITLTKDFYAKSRVDIGMVRNNLIRIQGNRKLCDVIVVIDDHIGKMIGALRLEAKGIYGIDNRGEEVEIGSRPGIMGGATGMEPAWASSLEIFPNPSKSLAWLAHPDIRKGQLCIYNHEAKVVGKYPLNPGGLSPLNLEKSPPGVYLLTITGSQGSKVVRKLLRVP